MLKSVEPKNARAKRAMDNREPKYVENVKQALFVPGLNCNQVLQNAMVDLNALKKPDAKRFNKKNDIRPFEDPSSLEFFSDKNDCSLMVFGSHNKKRPNNLTFIRTFSYKIYDMIELKLESFRFLKEFRKQTFQIGMKPMFTFNGPLFDTHPTYQQIKSLFLDFFRGQTTDLLDVAGLQHIISISAAEEEEGQALPLVHFRVYLLKSERSSNGKLPRVELNEIGPRFDFKIGRVQSADPDMEREAMKTPKQLVPKTKKNIETDDMGDQIARVHLAQQDLGKMQTRKMKGLKSKFDQLSSEDEDDDIINDQEPVKKKSKTK